METDRRDFLKVSTTFAAVTPALLGSIKAPEAWVAAQQPKPADERDPTIPRLKIQRWQPTNTHPGHFVDVEWEFLQSEGRDTGKPHVGVAVWYPDGSFVHRDTHGQDVVTAHYEKILEEHRARKA